MSITSQPPENGFAPWSLMGPSQGSSPSSTSPKVNPIQLEPKTAGQFSAKPESSEDSDELSFGDFLDVINPLQHIPIVSTVYREVTGDEIGSPARIAGGTLFGGVIGLASGLINSIVDETSGKDVGEHIIAALSNGETSNPTETKTTDLTSTKSVAEANTQAPAQLFASAQLPKEQSRPSAPVVSTPAPAIVPTTPAQTFSAFLQKGPSLEQIAALNMASQDKMKIIAQTNPKISDNVVPLSGPMADKLRAITTGAGGLNFSHMPGAAATNPVAASPAQKTVDPAATTSNPTHVTTGKSFKLSDDVRKQLDHIGKIQQERAILSLQEKPAQQAAPAQVKKVEPKPILPTETVPQITAYQKAKNITQAGDANQPIEVSEAMMNALQKYDNLLNGRISN